MAPGQEAKLGYLFPIFYNINVCCVFPFESPHRAPDTYMYICNVLYFDTLCIKKLIDTLYFS